MILYKVDLMPSLPMHIRAHQRQRLRVAIMKALSTPGFWRDIPNTGGTNFDNAAKRILSQKTDVPREKREVIGAAYTGPNVMLHSSDASSYKNYVFACRLNVSQVVMRSPVIQDALKMEFKFVFSVILLISLISKVL